MGSLVSLLFPALVPALTDGLRGLISKWTGGAGGNPINLNERVQLMEAETKRLQALAEIDKPSGEPSLWVTNFRSMFRYSAILLIWLLTSIAIFSPDIVPKEITLILLDLSGASMSFIIGERMYFNLRK